MGGCGGWENYKKDSVGTRESGGEGGGSFSSFDFFFFEIYHTINKGKCSYGVEVSRIVFPFGRYFDYDSYLSYINL